MANLLEVELQKFVTQLLYCKVYFYWLSLFLCNFLSQFSAYTVFFFLVPYHFHYSLVLIAKACCMNAIFLDSFEKLKITTISFFHICRCVCPHGTTLLPLGEFNEMRYFRIFWKSVESIQVSLKCDLNNWYFMWRPVWILIISCSVLLRMRNVSDKCCREKKPHFMCCNFLSENWAV